MLEKNGSADLFPVSVSCVWKHETSSVFWHFYGVWSLCRFKAADGAIPGQQSQCRKGLVDVGETSSGLEGFREITQVVSFLIYGKDVFIGFGCA